MFLIAERVAYSPLMSLKKNLERESWGDLEGEEDRYIYIKGKGQTRLIVWVWSWTRHVVWDGDEYQT